MSLRERICIQSMLNMKASRIVHAIAAVVLLLTSANMLAQVPVLDPRSPDDVTIPKISFEFELPGGNPPHYGLTIEAGGRAAYRSDDSSPVATGADATPPFLVKFLITPATADKIFDLAKALNYFDGNFDYRGGRIANMGAKTLTYKNGSTEHSTTYNYSQNQNLQQLTSLFQGIANSLEYRRRLERLYRYDKLGLEAELKAMEEDLKHNYIAELQVDESILRQIAGDRSVMNITRHRAENILGKIPGETAAAGKQ
jgi:hypothetical protein